jgi:pimeloyl-ACP methyl ester carboxylesterase
LRCGRSRFARAVALTAALSCGLAGCAALRTGASRDEADRIARSGGLSAQLIDAGYFALAAYQRIGPTRGDTLVVYIEGDGLAWINRGQPSDDPTPTDPVSLRLAAKDDASTVLYLARPCQFVAARNCEPRYWAEARYAREVVESMDRAIGFAKEAAGERKVELIGYSGGGVLATLVAARRADVSRVITIAANLDLGAWTTFHHVSPLSESLDPSDYAALLARVPQIIFVGDQDEVVPRSIVDRYRERLPLEAPVKVIAVPGYTHDCCWAEAWPSLVRAARASPSSAW